MATSSGYDERIQATRAGWRAVSRVPGVAPVDAQWGDVTFPVDRLVHLPAVADAVVGLPERGPGLAPPDVAPDDGGGEVRFRELVVAVLGQITLDLAGVHHPNPDGTVAEGEEPGWRTGLIDERLIAQGLWIDEFDGDVLALLQQEPGVVGVDPCDVGDYHLRCERPVRADEALAMVLRALGTAYRAAALRRGIVTDHLPRETGRLAVEEVERARLALLPMVPAEREALFRRVGEALAERGFRLRSEGWGHRTVDEVLHQEVRVSVWREGARLARAEVWMETADLAASPDPTGAGADRGRPAPPPTTKTPLARRTWTVDATTEAVLGVLERDVLPWSDTHATRRAFVEEWHAVTDLAEVLAHAETAAGWGMTHAALQMLTAALRREPDSGRVEEQVRGLVDRLGLAQRLRLRGESVGPA